MLILSQAVPPSPLNRRLNVLQVLGAYTLPLLVAARFRPEHHPLFHVTFAVAEPTGMSRLGEVHNMKDILVILAGVSHSEMEPLLVAPRVGVDLDVHLIVSRINPICLEQITRLKKTVHQQHVSVVVAVKLYFVHFVIRQVLVQFL